MTNIGSDVKEPMIEAVGMTSRHRPKVLVIARNFPNPKLPTLGIWTERLVRASMAFAEPVVVAPVPWFPRFAAFGAFRQFGSVPRERTDAGLHIHHPRMPVGPGMWLHAYEHRLWEPLLRRLCDRLHERHEFQLIHAHFIYPEGVIAARLGQRYGIPVVTTEQAPWIHWFDAQPRVGRLVRQALPALGLVTAVSQSLAENIVRASGIDRDKVQVVHNAVDGDVFVRREPDESWDPNEIIFVGVVRHVKGLDVLVDAISRLLPRRPDLRLRVVGNPYYRAYRRDEQAVRQRIAELGIEKHVVFMGQAAPSEVAQAMRRSAVLVVPSRRETFSAVTVEALACGTPVVATRCGGPEEILSPETGRLVPVEDPAALAAGIEEVLQTRNNFDPSALRAYALSRFGKAAVGKRIGEVYGRVLRS